MSNSRQHGIASWELILVIVIVTVIGFAGYEVYKAHKKMDVTPVQNEKNNTTPISAPVAPSVTRASDLNSALATINLVDPNSANAGDTTQLNSQLAGF